MSKQDDFNPYIQPELNKLPAHQVLGPWEITEHLDSLPVSYYGETPSGFEAKARDSHDAISVDDDSGETPYSVLVCGDLLEAQKVLVKAMSWSDHPGRGFEALREALIADPEDKLAVIGVSFPGAGVTSHAMTVKQRESLSGTKGDFSYISAQQWQAILEAVRQELESKGLSKVDAFRKYTSYDYIISGSSQGASNAVGLLQSLPEHLNAKVLALAESPSLEARRILDFALSYVRYGSKNFGKYVGVNSYNEYESLGPGMNLAKNVITHPGSHVGSVIGAMARGGDIDRITGFVRDRAEDDFEIRMATGSEDGVARAKATRAAKAKLGKVATVHAEIWKGHHHPAMENLANAQHVFRSFTR